MGRGLEAAVGGEGTANSAPVSPFVAFRTDEITAEAGEAAKPLRVPAATAPEGRSPSAACGGTEAVPKAVLTTIPALC